VKYGLQRNVCDQVAKLHEPFTNVMSRSIRKDNVRNYVLSSQARLVASTNLPPGEALFVRIREAFVHLQGVM